MAFGVAHQDETREARAAEQLGELVKRLGAVGELEVKAGRSAPDVRKMKKRHNLDDEDEISEIVTLPQQGKPAFQRAKETCEAKGAACKAADLWEALDKRFPAKAVLTKEGEVMDQAFTHKAEKEESTLGYLGRTKGLFSKAEALEMKSTEDDEL